MSKTTVMALLKIFPRHLQARSLMFLVSIGFALGAVLTWVSAAHQKTLIFAELHKRGKVLTQSLAKACVLPMMLEDRANLEAVVSEMGTQADVTYIVVRDAAGRAAAGAGEAAQAPDLTDGQVAGGTTIRRDKDVLHVAADVRVRQPQDFGVSDFLEEPDAEGTRETRSLGTVQVGLSSRGADKLVRVYLWKSAAGTAVILLIGGALAFWLFHGGVVSPLDKILEATRAVSRRQPVQIGELGTTFEFNRLATSFNKMLYDVQTAREDLEARVRERTQALEDANRDLTQANEVKSRFVSMVSHELRTPLAAIKGFLLTLTRHRETLPPEKTAQYLGIASRESERLGRLIEDLLDISRIQDGRVEVKAQRVELAPLAQKVLERYRLKGGRTAFELQAPASGWDAQADPDKVEQVLVNLLDNAARFTPEGRAVRVEGSARDGECTVEVADEGPGVPAELLEKIFEPFFRAENEVNARNPGTGLGLAISRSLAEAMGGKLTARNTPPRGARFTLTLPRAKST